MAEGGGGQTWMGKECSSWGEHIAEHPAVPTRPTNLGMKLIFLLRRFFKNRKASEGLVGIYIDAQGTSGVALEVNCETDFVSKNATFKQLVSGITRRIAEAPQVEQPQQSSPAILRQTIRKFTIQPEQLNAFQDSVNEAITQLGEKIKLNRALIVKSTEPKADDQQRVRFVGYTHSAAGSNLIEQGVLLGKYGTIVAFRPVPDSEQVAKQAEQALQLDDQGYEIERPVPFEESSRNVCQHIIGMKPTSVGAEQMEETRPEVQKEKSAKDAESGALLEQQFLLDDDQSVREYLQFNGIDVVDFVRLECGEPVEETPQ